jgi:hypothetical protein
MSRTRRLPRAGMDCPLDVATNKLGLPAGIVDAFRQPLLRRHVGDGTVRISLGSQLKLLCRASRIGSLGYVPSVVPACLPPSLRRNCHPSEAALARTNSDVEAIADSDPGALSCQCWASSCGDDYPSPPLCSLIVPAWVTLWITLRVGCRRTAMHTSGRMTQQLLASIHSRGRPRTALLVPKKI